jgi:hypothetical protein
MLIIVVLDNVCNVLRLCVCDRTEIFFVLQVISGFEWSQMAINSEISNDVFRGGGLCVERII